MEKHVHLTYCYAPADQLQFSELAKHLGGLRSEGVIEDWSVGDILAGANRPAEIANRLAISNLVLVLLSADLFIGESEEMLRHAEELATRKQLLLVPVMLRAVDWARPSLTGLRVLPSNGIPVTSWPNLDEAWKDVACGVRALVGRLCRHAVATESAPQLALPFLRNPDFVGRRQELDEVHRLFWTSGRNVIALVGLGGVGKTQLALEYAYEFQRAYRRVLWINAEGTDITASFAALARALELPAYQVADSAAMAHVVTAALEQGGPQLLVLDNVSDPAAYLRHLPRSGAVRVLITTRRNDLEGVQVVEVEILPEQAALQLLLKESNESAAERAAAGEICRELGCLPLAVDVARRTLHLRRWQPSHLLKEIRREGLVRWTSTRPPNPLFQKSPSVAALFRGSLEQVCLNPHGPRAQAMAMVGGWFAPAGISRQLLFAATDRLLAPKSGAEQSRDPAEAQEQNEQALEELNSVGLVKLTQNGDVILHRLIQAFLREEGPDAGAAVLEELVNNARLVEENTLVQLQLMPLRPHWEATIERLRPEDPRDSWWLVYRLTQHLRKRGEYEASLVWYERARALLKSLPDEGLCCLLSERGQTLARVGRYAEALQTYAEALQLRERKMGVSDALTATLHRNTGETLHLQDRDIEALACYTKALSIEEQVLGPAHACVANTLDAMISSLRSLRRYSEAERCGKRALAIKEKERGRNSPSTAKTLLAMGELWFDMECRGQAIAAYAEALHIQERTLGPKHPTALFTRFRYAAALHAADKTNGEQDMRATLQELAVLCGVDHPEVRKAAALLEQATTARVPGI